MKREFDPNQPELMDRPQPLSPELARDLDNLESLNRYFGSHRLLRRFLAAWFQPGRTYRVLDVCTGAGDLPRAMVDWARPRGISLQIDAIDAAAATLEHARERSAAYPEIQFSQADALNYTARLSYDFVHCSLALHHFSEEDAARLLRRFRELSHRYILVADLERGLVNSAAIWAVTAAIYRDPMTVHDARASARRAFSFAEFHHLAEVAGWQDFGHSRFIAARQAIWHASRDFGEINIPLDETLPCPT